MTTPNAHPYKVGDVVQRRGAGGQPGIVRRTFTGHAFIGVDVQFTADGPFVPLDIAVIEPWTPSVFEQALYQGWRQRQIERNIADNDGRRHEGNTLKHPAVSYQAALAEALGACDGRPVVCKNTIQGV
jgi:hypothetical protein